MVEIKRWSDSHVIISGDGLSLRGLVERAAREKTDLSRANLAGADLAGANLVEANLTGVVLPNFSIVPESGSFTAWKKVWTYDAPVILELLVPAEARRISSLVGRKCRVSCARPIQATLIDGIVVPHDGLWRSGHDKNFTYRIGTMAQVDDFNDDIRVEYAPGIHCFITRKEAVEY